MKTFLLVLLFLFPGFLSAQKVIVLSVNQSPEFGFSIEKNDTTIVRGASVELGARMAVFATGFYPSGQFKYTTITIYI
jgi:hypothetical protein